MPDNEGEAPTALPTSQNLQTNDGEEVHKEKVRLVWMAKDFQPPETTFDPGSHTVEEVLEPHAYFCRYFTEELFEEFALCTNLYSLQAFGTELGATSDEIKTFFGMLMIMGTLKFSRIRMYWQPATQIPTISQAMTVNRFFKIRSTIHITEPTPPKDSADKF